MPAVVVGQFGQETLDAIRRAVQQGHKSAQIYRTVDEAREALSAATFMPRCVFLESRTTGRASFIGWMRGDARLFSVPIIVMVPPLDDPAFEEAQALGADDVIGLGDTDGIRRRLVNLADFDPDSRPPISEGIAIVAHPEMVRRRILGRALRQAGFDLTFAADATELAATIAGRMAPRIVVLARNLPPSGAFDTVTQVRSATHTPQLPAIVLASAGDRDRGLEDARGLSAVVITSEVASPQDLVFLANDLLRPDFREMRGAPRLLYGTLCAFRLAGELKAVYGVTYNVSRDGMYVRTLDPPPAGADLWFELRPPSSEAVVHLRGHAIWASKYGGSGGSPPGFGLRIAPEACPPWDLQAYWEQYHRLVADSQLPV
jgi:CheY-like chemotaxis protein